MSGFYNNISAGSSSENMNSTSNTIYDIDSFLDYSGGYSPSRPSSQESSKNATSASSASAPSLPASVAHLALSSSFSGPSFQYDNYPQQVLPYNFTYPSFSGASSPSKSPMSLAPTDLSTNFTGLNDNTFPSSFMFPDQTLGGEFVDAGNLNFDDKDLDLDTIAGIKQERSVSNASSVSMASVAGPSKTPPRKSVPATDPATEERIRQILDDVKKRAMLTGDKGSDASNPLPPLSRAKKDEEDMDEDERLLASEEGKKLSSKERRQLRNKVSARAFRSRRKEYIGQLENEVAAKSKESAELREKLNVVEAENKSLKDLTKMLLASPQFSAFLDQLNPLAANNGLNIADLNGISSANSGNDNITVHRASIPEVQIPQSIQAPMDFGIPTYIPPHQQYMATYNPHKDANPNLVPQGVDEWPLAYSNTSWGITSTQVFRAELPTEMPDLTELTGKSMFDLSPVDGFRPDFVGGIPNEKENIEPDYSHSYDKNGKYIFEVFEDELEDVPEYLFDHFEIHAPLDQIKEAPLEPEDVLPSLGLEKLFTQLETMLENSSDNPTDSENISPAVCRDTALHRTLKDVESTYRRIGVYCGV